MKYKKNLNKTKTLSNDFPDEIIITYWTYTCKHKHIREGEGELPDK